MYAVRATDRRSRVHDAYMAKVKRRGPPTQYRRTFIRQWRKSRGLTLEQLADRVGSTHATLSRLEKGLHPYKQPLLERIADELGTDPSSLLNRDPNDSDDIGPIWNQAKADERRMIVEIAKTITKTTT